MALRRSKSHFTLHGLCGSSCGVPRRAVFAHSDLKAGGALRLQGGGPREDLGWCPSPGNPLPPVVDSQRGARPLIQPMRSETSCVQSLSRCSHLRGPQGRGLQRECHQSWLCLPFPEGMTVAAQGETVTA